MDELLQKLLEADVLSADTKKELETAFQVKLTEAIESAKSEAAADVRAELTEQWVQERDALIEAVDGKVEEFLGAELTELKDDIERFRDLEAEYAEKLVEAKVQMTDELKSDLSELVEKLDAFLEIRLSSEMEELKEDLDEVRKNDFGRRVFEAFASEYTSSYADDDSTEGTLRETEARLEDTATALEESERKLAVLERKIKLENVLSPLSGRQKEVMEAILKNVPTEQLDEGYRTFVGRVLKETAENADASEKENKVLAEGSHRQGEKLTEGRVVTGDNRTLIEEQHKDNESAGLSEEVRARLRKLAGL